jgi:hypothetical protein
MATTYDTGEDGHVQHRQRWPCVRYNVLRHRRGWPCVTQAKMAMCTLQRLTTQARMAMCNTGEDGRVYVITSYDTGEDGHVYVTTPSAIGERSDGKSGIAAQREGRASNVPVAVRRSASTRQHARCRHIVVHPGPEQAEHSQRRSRRYPHLSGVPTRRAWCCAPCAS